MSRALSGVLQSLSLPAFGLVSTSGETHPTEHAEPKISPLGESKAAFFDVTEHLPTNILLKIISSTHLLTPPALDSGWL